jgi:hypothetical protein
VYSNGLQRRGGVPQRDVLYAKNCCRRMQWQVQWRESGRRVWRRSNVQQRGMRRRNGVLHYGSQDRNLQRGLRVLVPSLDRGRQRHLQQLVAPAKVQKHACQQDQCFTTFLINLHLKLSSKEQGALSQVTFSGGLAEAKIYAEPATKCRAARTIYTGALWE